jgi:hypothetical protein
VSEEFTSPFSGPKNNPRINIMDLEMGALNFSTKSVSFYQTALGNVQEIAREAESSRSTMSFSNGMLSETWNLSA